LPIHLFLPTYDVEECLAEIRDCLEKGWTGLGYKTLEFEQAWCDHTGLTHAHFLNSATSGLHLAFHVLREAHGWQDGDEIITSPLTFVATNHAILYERLTPVFADVDRYLCLDPADVERKITSRTRAVVFVGIGGNTGQLREVEALCRSRGLRLVIDAAHMAGTRLDGATPNADVAVFSFHAVKPLPTADAGMICFAEAEHDATARKKSWLGIDRDTYARTAGPGRYRWRYEVESVGFKYHGNSVMAAIGLVQLRRLDRDVAVRREICGWYEEGFAGDPLVGTIPVAPGCASARHLYQVRLEHRDEVMRQLNEHGIYPGVHYLDNRAYPMYRQERDTCPHVTRASEELVSLPLHLRLTRADVETVIERVRTEVRAGA
jgi:dTDP-4-amino-4,6-dideoxygalactose transaminase